MLGVVAALCFGCASAVEPSARGPNTADGLRRAATSLEQAINSGDRKATYEFIPIGCLQGKTGDQIRTSLAFLLAHKESDVDEITAKVRNVRGGQGEVNVHTRYKGDGMTGTSNSGWTSWRYQHGRWQIPC